MKMCKRIINGILVICLIAGMGLTGCGSKESNNDVSASDSETTTTVVTDANGNVLAEFEEPVKEKVNDDELMPLEDVKFTSSFMFRKPDSVTYTYSRETVTKNLDYGDGTYHTSRGTNRGEYELVNGSSTGKLHYTYTEADNSSIEEYVDFENDISYFSATFIDDGTLYYEENTLNWPHDPLDRRVGDALERINWIIDESNEDENYFIFTCDDRDSINDFIHLEYSLGVIGECNANDWRCELKYDRVNKCLSEMNIFVDYTVTRYITDEGESYDRETTLSLVASDINSTTVEIPQDVIDNAVER